MKKFYFLLAIGLLLGGASYAKDFGGYAPQGGFVDAHIATMSIADVCKQPEDVYVSMQGYITKRLSDDTYNFTDGTDNIVVEIDDDVWRGQMVSPKEKVLVYGETDIDDGLFMVDVKSVRIVQ